MLENRKKPDGLFGFWMCEVEKALRSPFKTACSWLILFSSLAAVYYLKGCLDRIFPDGGNLVAATFYAGVGGLLSGYISIVTLSYRRHKIRPFDQGGPEHDVCLVQAVDGSRYFRILGDHILPDILANPLSAVSIEAWRIEGEDLVGLPEAPVVSCTNTMKAHTVQLGICSGVSKEIADKVLEMRAQGKVLMPDGRILPDEPYTEDTNLAPPVIDTEARGMLTSLQQAVIELAGSQTRVAEDLGKFTKQRPMTLTKMVERVEVLISKAINGLRKELVDAGVLK